MSDRQISPSENKSRLKALKLPCRGMLIKFPGNKLKKYFIFVIFLIGFVLDAVLIKK
jgi:hypothetical protein